MTPVALLEAVLFAAAKPLSRRMLMQTLVWSEEELTEATQALQVSLDTRGVQLVDHAGSIELVTRPEAAEAIRTVLGQELQGELSKAALETLAIMAYRGPLTRPEIEQIRGIQSSQILRHLSLRGLVEETGAIRLGQSVYDVTGEFFKHLGLSSRTDLPNYEDFTRSILGEGV